MENLAINKWAEEDRPREKLMRQGPSALSNAELLAILIGSGNTDESAVALMRRVMNSYNNSLSALGKAALNDLCNFKGIGEAKAVTILAALELGKRRKDECFMERQEIRTSQQVYEYFYPLMCDLPTEECWVLLLNQGCKVIDSQRISAGGLASASVDVRCILREALLKRAVNIILCHNHPSGNIRPSIEDDRMTEKVSRAAQTMNIRLADHVILTDGKYYSYCDEGKL